MEEKYYLYKGKLFSYGTIKEKYGDSTDTKISELGMEDAYEYNGKVFGSSTLKDKYGDDYKNVISDKGITEYGVKKKPQNEAITEGLQTVAEPLQESGGDNKQTISEALQSTNIDVLQDERLSKAPKILDLNNDEEYQVRKEIFSYSPEVVKEEKTEIDNQLSELQALSEQNNMDIKSLNEYATRIQNSVMPIAGAGAAQVQENINKDIAKYEEGYNKLSEQQKQILDRYKEISTRKLAIDERTALDDFNKKAEEGNWFGGLYNSLLYGVGDLSAGVTSDVIDLMVEVMPQEMYGGLSKDEAKKKVKADMLPYIRKGTKELAGTEGTTDEYITKVMEKNIFTEGLYGLARSTPAMVSPMMSGIYFQVKDGVRKEMEQDPELSQVSEWEKQAVQTPIAVAGMFLERFGFSKLAGSTKAATMVARQALSTLPKNATKQQFISAIKGSALEVGKKLGSGFLAEAETGAGQEITDTSIKGLYNIFKGSDLFEPQTVQELEKNIARAGIAEGIGGFGMSIPTAVASFTSKGDLGKSTNNEQFEMIEELISNPEAINLKKDQLQAQLEQGKISQEQHDIEINNIEVARQIISEIDETIPTEKRRAAYDLITEKKKIQGEIEELNTKDPDLVADKIAEKEQRLEEVSNELRVLPQAKTDELSAEEEGDVIAQLEKQIAKEERKLREQQANDELAKKRKPKEKVEDKGVTSGVKALEFLGQEVVDENGNVGTIEQEGSGRLVFTSGNRIVELGSAEDVDTVNLGDYGLSVKPDSDFSNATDISKKGAGQGMSAKGRVSVGEAEASTEAIMQEEEFKQKSEEELNQMIEQAEKDVALAEEIALEEAAQKSKNRDLVKIGDRIFQVTKKDDGTFAISQKTDGGKLVAVRDKETRRKAEVAFKSEKSKAEAQALAEAQKQVDDFRAEEQDKIEKFLDDVINATSSKGRAFDATLGIPMALVNTSAKVLKAAYKAGKSLAGAIEDAIKHIEKQGYKVNKLEYQKYILQSLKGQTTGSGAKKPQQKQSTAKTATAATNKNNPPKSKEEQEKEAKERRGNLKDIHKRKKAIIAKFKSGKFFNKAMVVSDFIGSLPRLSRIKDNELLKEILEEMKALTSSRVADVDENRIKALTEKVKKAEFENEKSTTSLQRAEEIIKGLAQKAKSVTNISNLVSLNLDIERAENELDNAVQQGEFGDLEDGSDSKKKYDALLEKIEQATEELSSPKKSTSYGMMIAFKGDITRAKNRINKALKDGQITEDRANQLKNDLEAAKKQLEEETKEFIQNRSKEARENLKGITISDLEKEHGLSRPAKIVLEGFLNQIKNYEPKSASDAEVLYKISDALSKGFIPYNEIGQMIKNIKSDEASNIIIPTISKIIDSVKKKASYEISRLLGEQMGAFKSEQLGEAFSETKVFEKFIYSPIQQAIKKSNQASLEMATELGNKMKKAQGRWGKRVLDSLLGKNSSRRAAIKVGVIKNILNEAALKGTGEMSGFQMESFASDGSKVEVGSRDWLGIILGKEAAVNDLNGDIKDKTKEAILAGKMLIPFQQKLGVFKRAVIKIKGQFGFHNTDIDIMNDIWESLPKKANGAVDLDVIVNDPNSYMNEMEAAYFEAITDAFNSSYEFIEVANMLKGMPIQRIDDYYKRSRFMSSDKELGYTEAGIHSNNLRIKAGSANIRTSNALGAIDFNSVNVAIQNIVESPRYFYIDQSGREVNSTLNKVSQQTEHKNVIEGIKQDTAASLIYNFTRGKTPALISKLISARYAYSLLDPIRVVALESVGLFLRGSFTNPKSLLSLGSRDVVSKMEKDFGLKIIKKATGQIEAQNTKISTKDGKTPIRKTGLGEMLMGIPENITSVMFFMPSFNESFFAITGKEFDSKRFLNDKQYLEENRKYIEESIDLANIELERVVGSETRFGDRRYVRYAPKKIDELVGGTLSVKADETAGRWLAFMSNYVYREGSVIFKPIKQVSQGKAPTLKAAYASGGAIIGGMYYTYMSALYYGISRILSGDDDEKEDVLKDWSDLFGVNFKDGKINVEKMAMKSVGVFLDQVFFYGVARYGQAIRTVGIVGLSLLNDLGKRTNNKFMEKETREALKTKFYTDPVNILSTYGLREFAAKNVPMLDMAVRLFSGMMENYKDILDKDIDKLDNDELNLLISLSALHNSINAVLAVKYGTQIPMTPKVKFMLKKEIDNMKKNTSRNSKKPKNLED